MFVSAPVDYLFIGSGITIPVFLILYCWPQFKPVNGDVSYGLFLAINGAHFAASAVRLYTKPGTRDEFPLLSWAFPVVCLSAVALGLQWPRIGNQIKALYFTWSPYHYAAQTYGLAVMYAMRSGARLDRQEKAQIWWVCMLPFVHAFFTTGTGGLFWFVHRDLILRSPALGWLYATIVVLLRAAVLLLPVSLFWQWYRVRGRRLPLICLVLQVTNGIWWIGSDYLDAWFFTALFHSIQYLIVITARHADERVRADAASAGPRFRLLHGSAFYGFSLAVGLLLFLGAPAVFTLCGFGALESYAMMTLVINLHHFVVDGFIWRSGPSPAAPLLSQPAPALG